MIGCTIVGQLNLRAISPPLPPFHPPLSLVPPQRKRGGGCAHCNSPLFLPRLIHCLARVPTNAAPYIASAFYSLPSVSPQKKTRMTTIKEFSHEVAPKLRLKERSKRENKGK